MQQHFWSLSRICHVFLTKMIPAPVTYYKNSLSVLLPHLNQHVKKIKSNDVIFTESLSRVRNISMVICSTYIKVVFFRINTIFNFLVKY